MISPAERSCIPAKDLNTSKAYIASSLVGTIRRAPSPSKLLNYSLNNFSTTGIKYDRVLPLPVLAHTTTSLPAIA
jgi:hypothetical protein